MASSSSGTSETIHGVGTIKKINDAVYEFHRPATGFIDLEIIFFHGFQAKGSEDAYLKTWMVAGGSACWLNTWFPEKYPQSRVMSVSYDSSTEVTNSEGRMDMHLVGENLAQSIIELAGVGQSCPVVLVGHGVGGLVLKEVCCKAEQLGTKLKANRGGINTYETFLTRMKGAFFFSTPQLGTRTQANPRRQSPLLKYYELLSSDSARLNSDFQDLRKPERYGWKTFGVIEANVTENCDTGFRMSSAISRVFGWKTQSSPVVEEGSGRNDMDDFSVLAGEDSLTICKPKERTSSSFQILMKFVQKVLEAEEWVLKQWQSTLQFPPRFISMPNRVKDVLQTLRLGQTEPSRVSLVGMGGIGKSTLAKELLVRIRSQFDFVFFVDDLKSRLKHQDLLTLIADNLYYGSRAKVRMQDPQSLWLLVRGKKVLLIMDNVDSDAQISTLLRPDWVGKGSRLITTSRKRTEELMPSFLVYEVPFLSMAESVNLFEAHVDTEIVKEIPGQIFYQVVDKCDGLPLAIEVIGSYVGREKDLTIWKEALERLRKAESINGSADDRLWSKLRVSFDGLGRSESRIFLDLVMFDKWDANGVQYDLRIWRTVWEVDSTVSSSLRNLVDRCFIRISGEIKHEYVALSSDANFAYIHEQLRDMGKSIIRPYEEKIELCRGVWQSEDVHKLLVEYKGGTARTEALSVANYSVTAHSRKQYPWSSIGQMQQLRLLRMSGIEMTGDGSQRFPSNLALLQISTCFREKVRRPVFQFLENDYWPIRKEDVGGLHKLRVLVLENCLSAHLPRNFHKLSNLKLLMLSGEQLTKLPKNFGQLKSLQALVLQNVGLRNLPDSFLELSSLQTLRLTACSALKALPDCPIPESALLAQNVRTPLCTLKTLTLEVLPALKELPESLGLLGLLEELIIVWCPALSKLPESLGMCQRLKVLTIQACDSLESVGESLGELGFLSKLQISSCAALRRLPDSLGQLKELRLLEIGGTSITSLPASIWNLQELRSLQLYDLLYLQGLPEPRGQMDTAQSIVRRNLLQFSGSHGLLRNLETLSITNCASLHSLPECWGQIDSLESITIVNCKPLERLPESVGGLRNLKRVLINGCDNLQSLSELGQVDSLQEISIVWCRSLKLPENLGRLGNLKILNIVGFEYLESLPEHLDQLHSLEQISIGGWSSLKRLPASLGLLRNLQRLHIWGCDSLESLPESMGELTTLETLTLSYCGSLNRLPESFWQLQALTSLKIWKCDNLKVTRESLRQLTPLNDTMLR